MIRPTAGLLAFHSLFAVGIAQPQQLDAPRQFPAAKTIHAVALGDLDSDGKIDAIAGYSIVPGEHSHLAGDGAGNFAMVDDTTFSLTAFWDVVLADFNNDGKLDVAGVTNGSPGAVIWRFGDGTGVFATGSNKSLGAFPTGLAVADINNDGKLDLCCSVAGPSEVDILLGDPATGFAAPTAFPVGMSPQRIAAADVNGDGRVDLVTPDMANNTISVLRNTGHGGMSVAANYPAGDLPTAVALRDFNHDGKIDAAVATIGNGSGAALLLLTGTGLGNYPTIASSTPIGGGPRAIVSADFDGDGNIDVATSNIDSGDVSVLLGTGGSAFGAATSHPAGREPWNLATADVNGDGRPDLVTADLTPNSTGLLGTITTLLNDGSGAFPIPKAWDLAASPTDMIFVDLDEDGAGDAAVLSGTPTNSHVSVRLGDGAGGFGSLATHACGDFPVSIAAADVNHDGHADVLTANETNNNFSVLAGDGAGSLAAPVNFDVGLSMDVLGLDVGDLNQDGIADVIVIGAKPSSGGGESCVFLGIPSGGFQAPLLTDHMNGVKFVRLADVNGDGRPDRILAFSPAFTIQVSLNLGNGTFGAATSYATGADPVCVSAADVNADGHIDVATLAGTANEVRVRLGDGSGALGAATSLPIGTDAQWLILGDIDLDGRPDVITTNRFSNDIVIWRGAGDGTFASETLFATPSDPYALAINDFDADGRPDVAVSVGTAPRLVAIRNTTIPHGASTPFGSGTPGWCGRIGMATLLQAKVDEPGFGFLATNVPENSLGLGIVTDAADLAGSDPFGLGSILHVDLLASLEVYSVDGRSDDGGVGRLPAAIPNFPGLAGKTYTCQSLWVAPIWKNSSTSPFGIVTSVGMTFTILP